MGAELDAMYTVPFLLLLGSFNHFTGRNFYVLKQKIILQNFPVSEALPTNRSSGPSQ
jgi:hypothetical protein